jgi:hypothetical protein
MVRVDAVLFLVAFRVETGSPALVTLVDAEGQAPSRRVRSDPDATAADVMRSLWTALGKPLVDLGTTKAPELWSRLQPHGPALAGAEAQADVRLIYTAAMPSPLAETSMDVASGTDYSWRTLIESSGRHPKGSAPEVRSGAEALVLDYWRQSLEETDAALDILPPCTNLLQLRGMYDAVWGYDQDPSGFKRWAVDRSGAFGRLLAETPADGLDAAFFRGLAELLPAELAAEAAALTRGSRGSSLGRLGPAVAAAAATTANRLFPRPGPEPIWYARSDIWRPGPSWIENLYPPRPSWTRWVVDVDELVG